MNQLAGIRSAGSARWRLFAATLATGVLLAACGGAEDPPRTVGILDFLGQEAVIDGFRAELADRGYVEGENVTYVIERVPGDLDGLGAATQRLVDADVDLIFTMSTPATIQAKRIATPLGIPIVFAPVFNPVASGIVESLREPGVAITGVQAGGSQAKLLEWFLMGTGQDHATLYVPHQPADGAAVQGLNELRNAAELLNLKLIVDEVTSTEELIAGIAAASDEIDAVISLSAGFFSSRLEHTIAATSARGWPVIGGAAVTAAGGVLSFGAVVDEALGRQAAGLAAKVLNGTPASDLPVETSPFHLSVNLAAAAAIGLELSENVVAQADVRIR